MDVDENAELDEENAEGKLRFSGGHGEAATYDDGDEEDKRIRAAAAKDDDDALGDEVRTGFACGVYSSASAAASQQKGRHSRWQSLVNHMSRSSDADW